MHNLIYWLSEDLRSNTWLVHSAFEESLKSINDLIWARRGMIPVLVCNVMDCPLLESSLRIIVVNSSSEQPRLLEEIPHSVLTLSPSAHNLCSCTSLVVYSA